MDAPEQTDECKRGEVLTPRLAALGSARSCRSPLCTARCWGAVDRGADAAASPSRAARDGVASAPKQTGGRGAAAAAKTSTFASLLFLVSSCSSGSRTRARSAPLRGGTTTGIRTGDIRAPARAPTERATESADAVRPAESAHDIRLVLSAGARALRRRAAAAAAAHRRAAARGRRRRRADGGGDAAALLLCC